MAPRPLLARPRARQRVPRAVLAAVAALLALAAAGAVAGLATGAWREQARALVVLAEALDAPVLSPTVGLLTPDPDVREVVLGGAPATVARPPGGGAAPALVFVNGATPLGRRHSTVQALVRGLARAGFLASVPDLPGLPTGTITQATRDRLVAHARALADRPDAEGGEVSIVGVSVGASLAILATADPALAGRVRVTGGTAPFADLRRVLGLAFTGVYDHGERAYRYATDPFLKLAMARSLAAALPPGDDRARLLTALAPLDDDDPTPLSPLRAFPPAGLGPGGRAVLRTMLAPGLAAFERRFAALPPGVRAAVAELSPLRVAGRVHAPVRLASSPRDEYFPLRESRDLLARAPAGELTVTGAFDHAIPRPTPRQLRDLARLQGYVAETLARAAQAARAVGVSRSFSGSTGTSTRLR